MAIITSIAEDPVMRVRPRPRAAGKGRDELLLAHAELSPAVAQLTESRHVPEAR
jgi:hypothetical protein